MTLELEVRRRLREAAASLPVDEAPVSSIVAAGRRRSRVRRISAPLGALVAVAVAGLIGSQTLYGGQAVPGIGAGTAARQSEPVESERDRESRNPPTLGIVEPTSGEITFQSSEGEAYSPTGTPVPAPGGSDQGAPSTSPTAASETPVVKTAKIAVDVPRGRLGTSYARAQSLAAELDGFVESASTEPRTGRVVLRVPAARFEEAIVALKKLGTVRAESVSGEEATNQLIDIGARLRSWLAQERVLLGLMRDATTIEGTIRVQKELQKVRTNVEELRGQRRVLRDRAAMSSIAVSLAEPGARKKAGAKPPKPEEPSTFSRAWDRAAEGAMQVFAAVVVGMGFLLPLALLLLAIWLVIRALRARVPR